MKKTKTKIIISIVIAISFISIISTIFAAFIFSKVVTGTATTGNIYSLNKSILNYSTYSSYYGKSDADLIELKNNNSSLFLSNLKNRSSTATTINSDKIECYASERTGNDAENGEYGLPYLNQIAFKFGVTTTIDLYVRIHFQDVWISKKVINNQGTISQQIITKDQVNGVYEQVTQVDESNYLAYYLVSEQETFLYSNSNKYYTKSTEDGVIKYSYVTLNADDFEGEHEKYYILTTRRLGVKDSYDPNKTYFKFSADSPFKISEKDNNGNELWYCTYDYGSNYNDGYAYYKVKIDVDENDDDQMTKSISKEFKIDNEYFYKEQLGAYYGCVKIQLSYSVEVVEANRVETIWHLNPEKLV